MSMLGDGRTQAPGLQAAFASGAGMSFVGMRYIAKA